MTKQRAKYANRKQRDAISTALSAANITHSQLAYDLRVHPTHMSAMLGGSKPLAFHYLPAIKFILLQHNAKRAQLARESLTPQGYPASEVGKAIIE